MYTFRDVSENGTALATALAFTIMWDDQGTGAWEDVSIWRPTCPEGLALRWGRDTLYFCYLIYEIMLRLNKCGLHPPVVLL